MTRDEILNRIAIKKHGRHFNEIFAIKSRAEILQQALDEVLEQVNNNAVLHSVTHRAWIVEYTIDDSDVLQFNVTDAPNQLAAKAVAMYGLPRKAKLLNCSPVLHGG